MTSLSSNKRGIIVAGLSHSYANSKVLHDINMHILPGQFVSIVGPFGTGKTTLLKIIAGLIHDYEGSVIVDGKPPSEELAAKKIGFASQRPTLLPWRNVVQNLALPLDLTNGPNDDKCLELLKLVKLESVSYKQINQLSGGMRQIVSILRALVLDPDILLLDEPFSSVDELTRDHLLKQLAGIHSYSNKTTIMVTHSLQEAAYLSDTVYVLGGAPYTTVRHKEDIALPKDRQNLSKYDPRIIKYADTLREKLGSRYALH